MKYKHIVFDIDNTLLNTEYANLRSLHKAMEETMGVRMAISDLKFALGIPGKEALKQLGVSDIEKTYACWISHLKDYHYTEYLYGGIKELLEKLKLAGCILGIVTSKTREGYEEDFAPFGLVEYFETVICADDTETHKPDGAPLIAYMARANAQADQILYIGDAIYDMQCAAAAGADCGLAVWGSRNFKHIRANYYFNQPYDVWNQLTKVEAPFAGKEWISWSMELQFIAQAGITYSRDDFDKERFERVREISAELMAQNTGIPMKQVQEVFCNETGFQTPKIDTRGAVFRNDKILLVKEMNGTWSLPGGWVDVNQSVASNTIKEVKEEAGLDVVPVRLIALHDRNRHNEPVYAYGVCKAFILCELLGGEFAENTETVDSSYFSLNQLPDLALEKNTPDQVRMCFEAYKNKYWNPVID